jgi:hypothetical protein
VSDAFTGVGDGEPDWDAVREEQDRFDALPPERQAHEMNRCESWAGTARLWIVVGGEVVVEGGTMHAIALARERALMWRSTGLVGIARPLLRIRARGRARRGRRATERRTSARGSPGREGPEPPSSCEVPA